MSYDMTIMTNVHCICSFTDHSSNGPVVKILFNKSWKAMKEKKTFINPKMSDYDMRIFKAAKELEKHRGIVPSKDVPSIVRCSYHEFKVQVQINGFWTFINNLDDLPRMEGDAMDVRE